MKKHKEQDRPGLFEIIIPFDGGSGADEFFDDCPECQELKRKIEAGEVESVPFHFDFER